MCTVTSNRICVYGGDYARGCEGMGDDNGICDYNYNNKCNGCITVSRKCCRGGPLIGVGTCCTRVNDIAMSGNTGIGGNRVVKCVNSANHSANPRLRFKMVGSAHPGGASGD